MTRKAKVEKTDKIIELTKKRKIEDRHEMIRGITDCQSLAEIKILVDSLISDYGDSAKVNFDSGYNNISEEIVVVRDETDAEVNARIDKEIEALIKKELAIKNEGTTIAADIQSLMKAKN